MRHRVPKKRLLALMLAAMMVFTLIPAVGAGTVLAAEDGAAFPLVMLESAVGTSVNDWTPRIGTTANPSNPAVEFTRCEERNLLGVTTHTNVPNVHFVQTFTFPRPAVDPLAESGSNGTWFRFSVDVWSDVPPSPDGHGGHNTGFRVTSGVRNSGLTYGHYAAGSSVGGWQTIVTYGMVPATGGATVNMTMELNHSRGSSPSRANSGTTTTYWTNIRIEQLSLDHSIQTTLYAGDFGDTTQGHGQGERYVTVSGMSNEWRILGVVVQHVDVVVPHAVTGLYERRTVSRSEATVNHGRRAFADFAQSLYYMSGGNMRPFAGDRGWDEVLDGPFVPSVDVFVPTEPLRFFEVSDNRLIIAPHQAWDLIYREVARAREAGRPYDQVSFIFPNDGFPGGGIGGLAYGPHNGIRYNLNHMGLNGYTRSGTPTGAAPYGFPHAIVVHEFIHSIEQEGAWRGRAVPAVDGAGGTGGHGYWYHMDMRQNQTSPVVGSESLINMLPTTGPGSVPLQNHGGYANQPGRQVQHRNWGSYLYYLHMMHPDHYVQMGIAPEDRIGAWTTGSGSAQTSVPGGAWPSGSNANNRTQTPPRRGYDVREFTRERFTDTPVMFYALSAAFDMVRPAGYAVGSVTEAGASQNYVWVTEAGMPAAPENGQTLVFGISERNDPNSVRGWQTDPIFARRTHDTNFYIFARAAGNLYYETGAASAAYQVRTGAQGSGNDFVPRFNPQVRLISPTPGRFIPCELTPYGTDADFYITFGFDRAVVPIEGGQIEIPGPALYAWTVAPDGAVSPTRMGGFIQPPMVATLTISADHIEMERGEPILDYYGYPTGEYEYVPVPVTEFTVHITEFANHASIGGIRGFASVRAANGGAAANLRVSAGAFMDMDVRFSDALSQDSAFFYGPIYGFGEDQDPGASRPVDGEYAMVITYDHQMVRVIDGGTYRIGTAFVAGAGMVAIAIPNELRTPFQAGTPLLQSNMINAGVIVRLGDMIPSESLGLIYDLYRLDVVRDVPTSPTQAQLEAGPVVSNYFQGLIREVIWTNGTVLNAKGWMFGGFLGANANIPGLDVTFGRLTSYEDGEFTVGADFRGFPVGTSMDTATQFTLPGNMQVPVYRLENNRGTFGGGGTVNTAHRFAGRYRLSASEINAANQRPAVNAARRIYTIIWHTPTDPTDILSMVFIVDYRPDPDRDYFTEPCDDCGEYPCVCPEFCDDCTEYPCVCPELTGRYAVISYVMGNQVTVGGAAHRIGRAVVTGEGEVNILIPQVMISGGGDNILDNYWMMRGQMIQLGSRANVPGVTRIYSIGGEPAGRAGGGEGLLVSTTYGMLIRHLSFNHGLGVMHRNSPGVGPYRDRGMLNFALWHYRGAIGRSNVVIGRVIDFDPSTGAFAINTTVDPAPVQADIPRSELGTNWDVNSTIFLPIPELAIPVTRELSIPGSNQSAAITVMNPNGIAQSDRILDRFTLNEAEIAAANGVAQMGGPQRVYAVVWLDPADLDNGEPRAVSFIVDTRPSVNYGTTPDLAAPPVFGLRAYNSGRINVPGLGENGLIRVRTTLDGTDAPIPYYGANITAVFENGECAERYIVNVNRIWNDRDNFNFIDVNFNSDWTVIYLSVTAHRQTVTQRLLNPIMPIPDPPLFEVRAYNSGRVTVADLGNLGLIRVHTVLDGIDAPIPYYGANITAVFENGECAERYIVNVNRIWNDRDNFNFIDVNFNSDWTVIYLSVTAHGQTITRRLLNPALTSVFGLRTHNSGSIIRVWTTLDGTDAPVPYYGANITAVFENGECAERYIVNINRIWNDRDNFNFIDVNFNSDWTVIYLSVTAHDQTVTRRLLNPNPVPAPVFGLRSYNSGRINVPGLGENGLIRVRTTINGDAAPVPYYGANITAVFENGECAERYIVNVNRIWNDRDNFNFIDVNFNSDWTVIYLSVTAHGQTVTQRLVNPDPIMPPAFGLRAYNSGRINVPGLGENGLIRVRTTLDGTDAPIPYYGANITAVFENGECAERYIVNVNRIWNDRDNFNFIDVNFNSDWTVIYLSVTAHRQTVTQRLVNPAP